MKQPNILLFLSDDHAGWALGCAGEQRVQTPNLDYLSRSGVRFSRAYTPCPVCSPARASLWTGTIPSWHGVHDHLNGMGHPGIGDQGTLADSLKEVGYTTAQIGKWHCHTSENNPPRAGFDRWFSHSAGTRARFGEQQFWDQHQIIDQNGFQAPMITERVISFLRSTAGSGSPFLCAVGYTNTHRPFADVPQRLINRYSDATLGQIPTEEPLSVHGVAVRPLNGASPDGRATIASYAASVTFIDEQIGIVLDEIDSLGLTDNTLVVYTSDHGLCVGHHGLVGKGNATVPQNFLDENLGVPLIARLPGLLDGGRECVDVVNHMDTYATIRDLAGAKDPDTAPRPGRSWNRLVTPGSGHGQEGDDETICEYGNARMIRSERYKLIRRYPGPNGVFPDELYDLADDPRESRNILERVNPVNLTNDLDRRLERYFSRFGSQLHSGLRVADMPPANIKEPWRVSI